VQIPYGFGDWVEEHEVRGCGSIDAEKKRLGWGLALTWVPVVIVWGMWFALTFRDLSQEKATGLGAIAAELGEALVLFGLVTFLACQVAGITLLAREIRGGGWGRAAECLVSLGSSLVVLTLVLLSFWWLCGIWVSEYRVAGSEP
jgi:hypothetical protein